MIQTIIFMSFHLQISVSITQLKNYRKFYNLQTVTHAKYQ